MWSGIWSVTKTRIGFWTWIWPTRHCGLGQEVACWKNSTSFIWPVQKQLFLRKNHNFKILGLNFPSKFGWGSYIISIAKTACKKTGALICSMKFLSPEVALYLYKSTIHPCMEYCCHVWAVASCCYLELFGKLQNWIYRIVGPSLAASLEPLTCQQNVPCLSLFYRL